MDAEQLLAAYRQRVEQVDQRVAMAQARLATSAGTASSSDGAVTLTVSPSGALQELTIGPRAAEMSPTQLAALILATARRAHATAAEQAAEAMRPLLGADSAAMTVLRSQLAAPAGEPR